MLKKYEEIGCLTSEQLRKIQQFLFFDEISKNNSTDDSKYVDLTSDDEENDDERGSSDGGSTDRVDREAGVVAWQWGDFKQSPESENFERKHSNIDGKRISCWLQSSIIVAVGDLDLFIIAYKRKVVVIERTMRENSFFQIIAEFSIVDFVPADAFITCAFLLPISSTRRTETSFYDWITIVLGFSSGQVCFFTERGILLRSEEVSFGQIDKISFGRSILQGYQELAILSFGVLILFDGLPLFAALRTAKSEVAFGEKDLQKISSSKLTYIKLKLEFDMKPSDFIILEPNKQSYFDCYISASLSSSGPGARLDRFCLPICSNYLFTGKSPFLSFGCKVEEKSTQKVVSDAIQIFGSQIASSIYSALPSFGFASFNLVSAKKERVQMSIAESKFNSVLPMRTLIIDGARLGERIYAAPSFYKLAVVTDALGRIFLIDTAKRRLIRVWKGYRDAQCAWLESSINEKRTDSSNMSSKSVALFLVIYASRRGLLEIWSMQNGRRVSAANVGMRSSLIMVPTIAEQLLGSDSSIESFPKAFFLSVDGRIFKLSVSFYHAFMDEKAFGLHDENIIKEMNQLKFITSEEICSWLNLFRSLKSKQALHQAIDIIIQKRVVGTNYLIPLIEGMRHFIISHPKFTKSQNDRKYLSFAYNITTVLELLKLYEVLHSIAATEDNVEDDQQFDRSELLKLDESSWEVFLKQFNNQCDSLSNMLEIRGNFLFCDFISHFEIFEPESAAETMRAKAHWRLKTRSASLGNFIFFHLLNGQCSVDYFRCNILQQLNLPWIDLLQLFCMFWLDSPIIYIKIDLVRLLKVCEMLIVDDVHITEWFHILEENIMDSREIPRALSLCIICRTIFINKTTLENVASPDDIWETVEFGMSRWDIYLKNLMCMAIISNLPDSPPVLLRDLLKSGPAYYREKIGVWCSNHLPDPVLLRSSFQNKPSEESLQWVQIIVHLRELLPFSLRMDLVFSDCIWECVSSWIRNSAVNAKQIELALILLQMLFEFPHLQHGLCRLLWDTFFLQSFRQLWDLLNKEGGLPRKTTSSENNAIPSDYLVFVNACRRILEIMFRAIRQMSGFVENEIFYEDFIYAFFKEFWQKRGNIDRKPLSELLSLQKTANFHLVLHHCDVAIILELILSLNLRQKPCKMFDAIGERALFIALNEHPLIPMDNVADSLRERRQLFLESCVKEICHQTNNEQYWKLVLDLSHDWKLDVASLKIKEIVELYTDGRDNEAKKLVSGIDAKFALVQKLLPVLLSRTRALLENGGQELLNEAWRCAIINDKFLNLIRKDNLSVIEPVNHNNFKELLEIMENSLKFASESDETIGYQRLFKRLHQLLQIIK